MPFVPTPNVFTVEMRYIWNNEQCENVLAFEGASAPGPDDAQGLMEDLVNSWSVNASPAVVGTCALVELYAVDQSAQDGWTSSFPLLPIVPGNYNGPSMPNNVTLARSFKSNSRGRSARGRNYPPGMPEGLADGNIVSATWMNAWGSFYLSIPGIAADNGCLWVVLSRTANKQPRQQGVTFPIITSSFTDNIVDSQRRRLPGRGS